MEDPIELQAPGRLIRFVSAAESHDCDVEADHYSDFE